MESRNVISKKCRIYGAKNIVLQGCALIEDGVVLRGDKASQPVISLGKWCILREKCLLEPPSRAGKTCPQKVGQCVYIGRETRVKSAQIGSHVIIGDNCELGEFSIVKDCSVVPANTRVPRYGVWDGGECQEALPESAQEAIALYCRQVHAGIAAEPPFGASEGATGATD